MIARSLVLALALVLPSATHGAHRQLQSQVTTQGDLLTSVLATVAAESTLPSSDDMENLLKEIAAILVTEALIPGGGISIYGLFCPDRSQRKIVDAINNNIKGLTDETLAAEMVQCFCSSNTDRINDALLPALQGFIFAQIGGEVSDDIQLDIPQLYALLELVADDLLGEDGFCRDECRPRAARFLDQLLNMAIGVSKPSDSLIKINTVLECTCTSIPAAKTLADIEGPALDLLSTLDKANQNAVVDGETDAPEEDSAQSFLTLGPKIAALLNAFLDSVTVAEADLPFDGICSAECSLALGEFTSLVFDSVSNLLTRALPALPPISISPDTSAAVAALHTSCACSGDGPRQIKELVMDILPALFAFLQLNGDVARVGNNTAMAVANLTFTQLLPLLPAIMSTTKELAATTCSETCLDAQALFGKVVEYNTMSAASSALHMLIPMLTNGTFTPAPDLSLSTDAFSEWHSTAPECGCNLFNFTNVDWTILSSLLTPSDDNSEPPGVDQAMGIFFFFVQTLFDAANDLTSTICVAPCRDLPASAVKSASELLDSAVQFAPPQLMLPSPFSPDDAHLTLAIQKVRLPPATAMTVDMWTECSCAIASNAIEMMGNDGATMEGGDTETAPSFMQVLSSLQPLSLFPFSDSQAVLDYTMGPGMWTDITTLSTLLFEASPFCVAPCVDALDSTLAIIPQLYNFEDAGVYWMLAPVLGLPIYDTRPLSNSMRALAGCACDSSRSQEGFAKAIAEMLNITSSLMRYAEESTMNDGVSSDPAEKMQLIVVDISDLIRLILSPNLLCTSNCRVALSNVAVELIKLLNSVLPQLESSDWLLEYYMRDADLADNARNTLRDIMSVLPTDAEAMAMADGGCLCHSSTDWETFLIALSKSATESTSGSEQDLASVLPIIKEDIKVLFNSCTPGPNDGTFIEWTVQVEGTADTFDLEAWKAKVSSLIPGITIPLEMISVKLKDMPVTRRLRALETLVEVVTVVGPLTNTQAAAFTQALAAISDDLSSATDSLGVPVTSISDPALSTELPAGYPPSPSPLSSPLPPGPSSEPSPVPGPNNLVPLSSPSPPLASPTPPVMLAPSSLSSPPPLPEATTIPPLTLAPPGVPALDTQDSPPTPSATTPRPPTSPSPIGSQEEEPILSTTPSTPPPPAPPKSGTNIAPIVGGVVAGVGLCIVLVILGVFVARRRTGSSSAGGVATDGGITPAVEAKYAVGGFNK